MYGILYIVTNSINNKRYVGQTIQTLHSRWTKHYSYKGNNALVSAINKYGKENFHIKQIAMANSQEELDYREEYYIKLFKTLSPNGYNLMSAPGKAGKHSEETKKKIGDAQKGNKNHNFGKKASEETRRKMSKSQTGRIKTPEERLKLSIANSGVVFSEERKANISKALTGKTVPKERVERMTKSLLAHFASEEGIKRREKISISQLGKPRSEETKNKISATIGIKIIEITTGRTFSSMIKCGKELKISRKYIRYMLSGKISHYKGYIFQRAP